MDSIVFKPNDTPKYQKLFQVDLNSTSFACLGIDFVVSKKVVYEWVHFFHSYLCNQISFECTTNSLFCVYDTKFYEIDAMSGRHLVAKSFCFYVV